VNGRPMGHDRRNPANRRRPSAVRFEQTTVDLGETSTLGVLTIQAIHRVISAS